MTEFVVTDFTYSGHELRAAALFNDSRLTELEVERRDRKSKVDFVFTGTVDSVNRNIGGAFIDIGRKKSEEQHSPDLVFMPVRFTGKHALSPGQKIPVQIVRDAADGKQPVAADEIRLSGEFVMLTNRPGRLSFSKKLGEEQKAIIKKWIPEEETGEFGIVVRTRAGHADKNEVLNELYRLKDRMREILTSFEKSKRGDVLYTPEPFYVKMADGFYEKPDKIYTDIPLAAALLGTSEIRETGGQSLAEHFNLEHELDRLTGRKVYLASGAFLIIERTAAFTAVDVNSGSSKKGRIPEETYRRVNTEAAGEIMRQIRLRNLSGEILIDFIKMKSGDHRTELLNIMKKEAKREHIPTEAVDMTGLGIIELRRERRRETLAETLER